MLRYTNLWCIAGAHAQCFSDQDDVLDLQLATHALDWNWAPWTRLCLPLQDSVQHCQILDWSARTTHLINGSNHFEIFSGHCHFYGLHVRLQKLKIVMCDYHNVVKLALLSYQWWLQVYANPWGAEKLRVCFCLVFVNLWSVWSKSLILKAVHNLNTFAISIYLYILSIRCLLWRQGFWHNDKIRISKNYCQKGSRRTRKTGMSASCLKSSMTLSLFLSPREPSSRTCLMPSPISRNSNKLSTSVHSLKISIFSWSTSRHSPVTRRDQTPYSQNLSWRLVSYLVKIWWASRVSVGTRWILAE